MQINLGKKNDLVNNLYESSNQNSVINCLSSFLFKYEEKKSNQGKEDDTYYAFIRDLCFLLSKIPKVYNNLSTLFN